MAAPLRQHSIARRPSSYRMEIAIDATDKPRGRADASIMCSYQRCCEDGCWPV